jgi:hypothetical protein
MMVCEVTAEEAKLASGLGTHWPDRELRTWYYRYFGE